MRSGCSRFSRTCCPTRSSSPSAARCRSHVGRAETGWSRDHAHRSARAERSSRSRVTDTGIGIPPDKHRSSSRRSSRRTARRAASTAAPAWACRSAARSRGCWAARSGSRARPARAARSRCSCRSVYTLTRGRRAAARHRPERVGLDASGCRAGGARRRSRRAHRAERRGGRPRADPDGDRVVLIVEDDLSFLRS